MGGKRPDQYRIAPEETLSTDYKTRPLVPQDAAMDDHNYSQAMETRDGPWQAGSAPAKGRKDRKNRRRA